MSGQLNASQELSPSPTTLHTHLTSTVVHNGVSHTSVTPTTATPNNMTTFSLSMKGKYNTHNNSCTSYVTLSLPLFSVPAANGSNTILHYTSTPAAVAPTSIMQRTSTIPAIIDPMLAPTRVTSTLTTSSKLLSHSPPPHKTSSDTITFGLTGTIVSLVVIITLLVVALTLALIQNYKLKKLMTASKVSQTYDEVSIIPNYSARMSVSSVSTPSNNSISKDGFNQGYDRLLQHQLSRSSTPRSSTPRRTPLDYELPVISNIATNSHTALNISTESINNMRNNGYGCLALHKLHTVQRPPQDYEVPVSSLTKTVSSESINNDLFTSQPYDTVLLSPLPSGVYDYIPESNDDVTMVIDLHSDSESERLRHASTRTYEEVEIYNDIVQK